MQMEKELNHVPRREIDRSVEVLHFVGGEDSSRRVLCASGAPSTQQHRAPSTGAAHEHPSDRRWSDTAVQLLTCFSV